MTFLEPATGWFEIAKITKKTRGRISQIFNNSWLSHYPRPRNIFLGNGNEFKKDFLPLLDNFRIKPTHIAIKNTQAYKVYWKECSMS